MAGNLDSSDLPGLLPHRACRNCVQIKVKCTPQEGVDSSTCQRCYRLRKTCTTAAPTARKRRKAATSKVAQLESRINQLSTLLAPSSASFDTAPHSDSHSNGLQTFRGAESGSNLTSERTNVSTPLATPDTTVTSWDCEREREELSSKRHEQPLSSPRDAGSNACGSQNPNNNDPGQIYYDRTEPASNKGEHAVQIFNPPHFANQKEGSAPIEFCPIFLDLKMEKELFEEFRVEMTPFFPFVTFAPTTTVNIEVMKKERPFLFWACIAAVSYQNRILHKKLHEEMLRGISEHVIVRGLKGLDLLQGILVLTAWYHYHAHLNPQLVNLVHLAQAMVVDLGLNRPVLNHTSVKMVNDIAEILHGRKVLKTTTTLEERRAYLGCYYLTSKLGQCFGRVDRMKFNQHINECCEQLEISAEFKSDRYLVQLVRLQHLAGKYVQDEFPVANVPLRMYGSMLDSDLKRYQQEIPQLLQQNPHILLEIEHSKVCMHEPPYFIECGNSVERIESLHLCLGAIRCFFDHLRAIPTIDISHTSFVTWMMVMHMFGTLSRLSFLSIDGWSTQHVRTELNFVSVVQIVKEKYEAVHAYQKANAVGVTPWRFALYAEKMRRCQEWYEAKISAEASADAQNNVGFDLNMPDSLVGSLFDTNFDESFWQGIVCDWTSV